MGKPGGIRFRSMSKYKQIVKIIYPTDPEGDIQNHNIAKLVHFCEITPDKLIKVSRYIERKAVKDLVRGRINFVGYGMKIYQELIFKCRKHLNLFASNVLNIIKLSLEGNYPELKVIATETFIEFAKVLDEAAQYPELEALVTHFIAMSQSDQGELPVIIRIREEGLRGIRAYMGVLAMTDELDSFVTRFTDADNRPRFVPVILENITYRMNPLSPMRANSTLDGNANNSGRRNTISHTTSQRINSEHSLQTLASDVLRDVFTCANISVTSLFKAILSYLDSRNRWVTNNYAMVCFGAIYNCLKPQHEQILMTLFLQHLEQNRPANVKKQIMLVMVEFFRETTGHFMQIIDSLTRHLVSSVEIVSQDVRARDYEDHIDLQLTAINCVGVVCKHTSSRLQNLEAFNYVCEKLCSSKHFKPTGLAGAVLALTQCIHRIVMEIHGFEGFDPEYMTNNSLNLLRELAVHPHNEIRVTVHRICHSMLLSGQTLDSRIGSRKSINYALEEKLIIVTGEVVRDTILEQIKFKNNQPENFQVIYQTLNILLQLGGKKEFMQGFPIVFAMQKSAVKWKKIPALFAHTINTVVAAYLMASAVVLECPPLTTYVDEIIEKRKRVGHMCPCVAISKQPFVNVVLLKDKYSEEVKRSKVSVEYVLLDRDHAIDLMMNTPTCVLKAEPKLKRLLAKKIHRGTRTIRNSTLDLPLLRAIQDEEMDKRNSVMIGTSLLGNSSIGPAWGTLRGSIVNLMSGLSSGSKIAEGELSPNQALFDYEYALGAESGVGNNFLLPGVSALTFPAPAKEKIVLAPTIPADMAQHAQSDVVTAQNLRELQEEAEVREYNNTAALPNYIVKPFDAVASNCYESDAKVQHKLSMFSKTSDFTFELFRHEPTAALPASPDAPVDDKEVSSESPLPTSDSAVAKVMYKAPLSTLAMDFNIGGLFSIV